MPLRVATLFANIHITGAELRMLNFARSVNPDTIDFELIVISRSAERDLLHGSLRDEYAAAGVRVVDLNMAPWDDRVANLHFLAVIPGIWKMLRTVWKINRALRREKIDLVECHSDAASVMGTLGALLARTRYVVTVYDLQFWDRPFWRLLARSIFFLQRGMITDSHERARTINHWLWRKIPTYVVPNGILPPLPVRSREEVARELGIPLDPNVKIVGQVSRLQPDKGHPVIVEAAREVLEKHPNAIFVFCGYASPRSPVDYCEQLKATAARYGFADRLFIFGYPGQIGDVWQLIDVHVHASLRDSSPIAIHEGMSLGKPAVGTDEGGIPELIVDGHSGFIVPKNDSHAMAEALLKILQDPATAERLGANAKKRYLERHRPEIMARNLTHAFLTVAGRVSDKAAPAK